MQIPYPANKIILKISFIVCTDLHPPIYSFLPVDSVRWYGTKEVIALQIKTNTLIGALDAVIQSTIRNSYSLFFVYYLLVEKSSLYVIWAFVELSSCRKAITNGSTNFYNVIVCFPYFLCFLPLHVQTHFIIFLNLHLLRLLEMNFEILHFKCGIFRAHNFLHKNSVRSSSQWCGGNRNTTLSCLVPYHRHRILLNVLY